MAPSATQLPTETVVPVKAGSGNGVDNSNDKQQKHESPPQVQVMGKAKDGRQLNIRKYPKFETLEEERLYRKQHLAAAFRVFADRGFDEGVAGHISVRDPILTDHFCKGTEPPPLLLPLYVRKLSHDALPVLY